jgi:hypothetical protein
VVFYTNGMAVEGRIIQNVLSGCGGPARRASCLRDLDNSDARSAPPVPRAGLGTRALAGGKGHLAAHAAYADGGRRLVHA